MKYDRCGCIIFEVLWFERWSRLVGKIELLSTFILPKFFSVQEQLPTCGIFFYSGYFKAHIFRPLMPQHIILKETAVATRVP